RGGSGQPVRSRVAMPARVAVGVQYGAMYNGDEHGTVSNGSALLTEVRQRLDEHGIRSQVASQSPDDVDGKIQLIAPSGRAHTYLLQQKAAHGA
ncbi:MAG: hypothetical protein ACJ768_06495, partial [Gaiellaceae bacterium]